MTRPTFIAIFFTAVRHLIKIRSRSQTAVSITAITLGLSLVWCGFPLTSGLASAQPSPFSGNGLATVSTSDGITIFAEIADSPHTRAKGLMFRQSMAPDHGMLFLFPKPSEPAFWMKNTLISLDILWVDETGIIIHIESKVPICTRKDDGCPRYRAPSKSLQVLELNAGMAEKFDLTVGQQLKIDLPPMSFPY